MISKSFLNQQCFLENRGLHSENSFVKVKIIQIFEVKLLFILSMITEEAENSTGNGIDDKISDSIDEIVKIDLKEDILEKTNGRSNLSEVGICYWYVFLNFIIYIFN